LDCGELLFFDKKTGKQQYGILGRRVGYMPQELCLYEEFAMKGTIEYFGRIYEFPNVFVKSQIEYLIKLLDLPTGNRKIKMLSGGQKVRVSLAVAIFHEPVLLVLDEPTVGQDLVLQGM